MRTIALLVVCFALAAFAQGIALDTARRLEMVDCPVQGGDGGTLHAGSLTEGQYLFRVTGEQVYVCFHTFTDGGAGFACPTGGETYPNGTVFLQSIPRRGQAFSCRSAATDAGDVTWTRAY